MERNQKLLLTNSALASAYNGLTSVYLVAFALTLGASNMIIGLLGALPWLAQLITQIPGAELCQKFARKNIFIIFSALGKIFWLPLLATPFLFYHPVIMVVAFYILVSLFEQTALPAILSLIGDVVPEQERGSFSAKRIKYIGLFGVISMTLGGVWLQQFPKESPTGFAILFGFGALVGLLALIAVRKIDEPEYGDHVNHQLKEFFTLTGQLKHFVVFSTFFNFAYMIASPFFAVFYLKTLGMSYEFYGIVGSLSIFSRIVFSRYIGKLTDKLGDKPVAIIATIGTGLVPLLYLGLTPKLIWLVVPLELYSGLVWGALEISHFNLLIGIASPEKRAMQIAEHNFYSSIPLVIAPILGGWMTEHVVIVLSGIPLVFLISGILRICSSIFLLKIKEPRIKEEHSPIEVLKEAVNLIRLHPINGLVHSVQIFRVMAKGLMK